MKPKKASAHASGDESDDIFDESVQISVDIPESFVELKAKIKEFSRANKKKSGHVEAAIFVRKLYNSWEGGDKDFGLAIAFAAWDFNSVVDPTCSLESNLVRLALHASKRKRKNKDVSEIAQLLAIFSEVPYDRLNKAIKKSGGYSNALRLTDEKAEKITRAIGPYIKKESSTY